MLSSWAFLYFNFQPVEMESLPDKKCVEDIADANDANGANDDDDDDVDFPSRRRTQSLGQQTQKNWWDVWERSKHGDEIFSEFIFKTLNEKTLLV